MFELLLLHKAETFCNHWWILIIHNAHRHYSIFKPDLVVAPDLDFQNNNQRCDDWNRGCEEVFFLFLSWMWRSHIPRDFKLLAWWCDMRAFILCKCRHHWDLLRPSVASLFFLFYDYRTVSALNTQKNRTRAAEKSIWETNKSLWGILEYQTKDNNRTNFVFRLELMQQHDLRHPPW